MPEDTLKRYVPYVLGLLNTALSSMSSYTSWPLSPIGGFEGHSIVIALIAAAVGVIVAFKDFSHELAVVVVTGLLVVPALFVYGGILALGGASMWKLLIGLLIYFYIFFAASYILTHLERVILRLRSDSGQTSASSKPH